jgi:tetratricopeptide (TPR) repeat protein
MGASRPLGRARRRRGRSLARIYGRILGLPHRRVSRKPRGARRYAALLAAAALFEPAAGAMGQPESVTAAQLERMLAALGQESPEQRPSTAALTQAVKQLGDDALAPLIKARRDRSPQTRAWASDMLDALGKRTPGDAVQTNDTRILSQVLKAYGEVRDADALAVVLSFVNADRAQVRAAAREATLAYDEGALRRLKEAFVALTGVDAPPAAAADVARALFAAYDRERLQDVYSLLERGLSAQRSGQLGDAVADFDGALARQPMLDRRNEMVPAYVAFAESLEPADPAAARAYLSKALRLDQNGPQSSHVRSEIKYMEGKDLLARGIDDSAAFEQALALDPNNGRARAELDRLRAETESRESRLVRLAAAVAALAVALPSVILLASRRRKKP